MDLKVRKAMIKSHCKINLFLKILNRNNKGFHNIQTTTMLLSLCDKISIKRINKNKDEIIFTGPFKNNINSKTNTVIRTLSLLRSRKFINNNNKYKVKVDKQIPVFAGLGGGTGNAATIIKYFFKKKISPKLLKIFEDKVSSDIRLLFFNHSFQKSLKKVTMFKKKYKFYFVLIYPNVKSSTKEVYSKVRSFNAPLGVDPLQINTKSKYINFLKTQTNDLQKIVLKKHKKIQSILNLIQIQKKCLFSRMTGSGSVCFGAFSNRKSASLAFKVLKKKFPNYWSVLTKSI